MRYELNKKVMLTSLIISFLIILSGVVIEGKNLITTYEKITCENEQNMPCPNPLCNLNPLCTLPNLQPGEIIENHALPNKQTIKIINYSVWIIIILSLIINHLKYNKKYKYKQLKENLNKLNKD